MKLIVGLGNPGKKYERTRHNVGFLVVDALMDRDHNKLVAGKGPFQVNKDLFQNGEVVVAKPTLFMNESGAAVRVMLDQVQIFPEQCLVVVDDVNLPIGKIRFRPLPLHLRPRSIQRVAGFGFLEQVPHQEEPDHRLLRSRGHHRI